MQTTKKHIVELQQEKRVLRVFTIICHDHEKPTKRPQCFCSFFWLLFLDLLFSGCFVFAFNYLIVFINFISLIDHLFKKKY